MFWNQISSEISSGNELEKKMKRKYNGSDIAKMRCKNKENEKT